MKNSPKSVTSILGQNDTDVSTLVRRANALSRLGRLVNELLPPHLRGRCQVANIRNKQLIILCNSAAWATHFRHEQDNLLHQLNAHPDYAAIEGIRIKIAPPTGESEKIYRRIDQPGSLARSAISELAETLEDPQLKASFERLSRTVSKK